MRTIVPLLHQVVYVLCGLHDLLQSPMETRARFDPAQPLFVASQYGNAACVSLLIDGSAVVDHRDSTDGQTALYTACWRGNTKCTDLLLRAHASVDLAENQLGADSTGVTAARASAITAAITRGDIETSGSASAAA